MIEVLAQATTIQPSLVSTVVQLILAVASGGALVALINGLLARRKVSADAESVAVGTANTMLSGLREEIKRLQDRVEVGERKADRADERADKAHSEVAVLRREVEQLRRHLEDYRNRTTVLENELHNLGATPPPWSPPQL